MAPRRTSPARDIANPTALLLSAVLMLQHLEEDAQGGADQGGAARTVLASGHVTPDLGGTATTTSFADAICRAHRAGSDAHAQRTARVYHRTRRRRRWMNITEARPELATKSRATWPAATG